VIPHLPTFVSFFFCHMFVLGKKFWHVAPFLWDANWACVHPL
jgi:hypothetical protein